MGNSRVAVTDVFVVLGIFAGFVFAAFGPQPHVSQAMVVIQASSSVMTQAVVADSDPVLAGAQQRIGPATSLASLRRQVQVRIVTSRVILIRAQGQTDANAKDIANAVADSFVAYGNGRGPRQAQVLDSAEIASGAPLSHRLLVPCGLGGLIGALVGAMAVVLGRGRRLRTA
jgi:capsular polysaccharide biosynthesis protein